jgi:hypothetical protein
MNDHPLGGLGLGLGFGSLRDVGVMFSAKVRTPFLGFGGSFHSMLMRFVGNEFPLVH